MTSTFSSFDMEKLKIGEVDDQRAVYVHMARTAESCERYEDMCEFMKGLVLYCYKQQPPLQLEDEERNLLSVAYKNVIGARRSSWRTLSSEDDESQVKAYREEVEEELKKTCNEILQLLETNLCDPDNTSNEAMVFYKKMQGDYHRYLAESTSGEADKQANAEDAEKYYGEAYKLAGEFLQPTHPIRLGLALNYSVCHYEILDKKEQACSMAKEAFDSAIAQLDHLEEADYKDSTLIMQLLRDNLTLWTSDNVEEDEGDH